MNVVIAVAGAEMQRCCVLAVKQERAELCKRESIEKFDKDQLKKTNTVEKNPLPDSQGMYVMHGLSEMLSLVINILKTVKIPFHQSYSG